MATLVIALPEAPDRTQLAAHWWLVDGERILDTGQAREWTVLSASAERVVALAPSAAVRLAFHARPQGDTERQALTVARLAALDGSLGDNEALHVAAGLAPTGEVVTALTDNGRMLAWLDWLAAGETDPDAILPSALLLPRRDHWTAGTFGTDHLVGRDTVVMPNEPALVSPIIGADEVVTLTPDEAATALALAAAAPFLNLRSGRFARRRRFSVDRLRIRELAILSALVAVLTLAWALVSLWKLDAATDRLNADTLRRAEAALGRPVALETAENELVQARGAAGGAALTGALAALYQSLQLEAGVSSASISYAADGTLSVTIAAPTVDPLNRVLLALQRDGFQVTAVPRQATDGRQMIDMTVRGGA